jgi:hypothetical protein
MKADFIEVLASILTEQDCLDWARTMINSPELYKMLLIEFQGEVIEEMKKQAKL